MLTKYLFHKNLPPITSAHICRTEYLTKLNVGTRMKSKKAGKKGEKGI